MYSIKDFARENELILVAHRGASAIAPENTLAAFREAIRIGAKMLETDVQLTSDGEIIAFHDFSLSRTTDSSIENMDFSYANIKNLDVGSWFAPEFKDERVPTLDQILELIKGKAFLLLEVKYHSNMNMQSLMEKLMSSINRHDMKKQVMFGSFNYEFLKEIKQFDREIPIAVIKNPEDNRLPSELANLLSIDAYICALEEITEEIANDAHKHGIFCGIYSADTEEEFNYAKQFNLNGIGTNNPERIIKLMTKKS